MRTIAADYADLNSTIRECEPELLTRIDGGVQRLALLASTDEMELLPESDKKTSVAEGVNIPVYSQGSIRTRILPRDVYGYVDALCYRCLLVRFWQ